MNINNNTIVNNGSNTINNNINDNKKNGLFIFIGESFRLGNQHSRNRGNPESYDEQINACKSHISFIEYIEQKFNIKPSVFISSYKTQYDNNLLSLYEKYIIGSKLYDDVIGLTNIFKNTIKDVVAIVDENNNIENGLASYDFIFYIRIDLFLKPHFFEVFYPYTTITFPSVCWYKDRLCNGYPRISDTMFFIPKKYFKYILLIHVYHNIWYELINQNTELSTDDFDVMINTYHDSDSYKDFNPLYCIVNRTEAADCDNDSKGKIFDKYNFS